MNNQPTNPFVTLLKSKRFWVMLFTAVVDFVVATVPDLAAVRTELLTVFTALGGILVAGYSVEDAAAQIASAQSQSANSQSARDAYERSKDR